jgi:uncharacterized DUF497 family protein
MFEWDSDKAASNLLKHGVSFEEAATVFEDVFALTVEDSMHSDVESRLVTLGVSSVSRLLLVVNTERGDNIRIISARSPSPAERRFYESQL